jgi:hypothetical protein
MITVNSVLGLHDANWGLESFIYYLGTFLRRF